ncbi:hypothetical protein I350_05836 [Cryptococcus amylolentus CBS 6273]|nr:hypothetical protein I350_05836 [Cryptococcus amylolentus CBS 6273]
MLLNHPFYFYKDVVVPARHDRKETTSLRWLRATMANYLWLVLVGVPSAFGVAWTLEKAEDGVMPGLMLFMMILQILFLTVVPGVVMLHFNNKKADPLPPGVLHNRLETLAHKTGFPLEGLYVLCDKSTESTRGDVSSRGPPWSRWRRLLLDGALLEDYEVDQVVALAARTIGNWYHSHTLKCLIMLQVNIFIYLSLVLSFRSSRALPLAFGFNLDVFTPSQRVVPAYITFQLAQTVLYGGVHLYRWLCFYMTRRCALEADAFAAAVADTKSLRTALIKRSSEKMDPICNDWLYVMVQHDGAPRLAERLEALDQLSEGKVDVSQKKNL